MTQLIGAVRKYDYGDVSPDGSVLAVGAIIRCADVLDAMVSVDPDRAGALIALGFREVIETAINGLYCLARQDDFTRFAVEDLRARERLAKALDRAAEMGAVLAQYGWLIGERGMLSFGQRVDEVHSAFPNYMPSDQVALTKAMYGFLSNFGAHGGAGVIADYLEPTAAGLLLVPHPESPVHPRDAIGMSAGFIQRLFEAIEDRSAASRKPDASPCP